MVLRSNLEIQNSHNETDELFVCMFDKDFDWNAAPAV